MNSKKFEKHLDWKFEIRFEGKIIRFIRFEKFSIRLIRKYIFNSKNSRKIDSKFVRFDSTPPLARISTDMAFSENELDFYSATNLHAPGLIFHESYLDEFAK